VDDEHAKRVQDSFRNANGRLISLSAAANVGKGRLIAFFCECSDESCYGRILITAGRYEATHPTEGEFVILPGHQRIEGEQILEANEYYEVVKKAA